MAIFHYKGLNSNGKELQGNITAESMPSAKQKLKTQGILLTSIKETMSRAGGNKGGGLSIGGQSVNINELSLMTRQLATLVKAKIPLVECISALADQVESPVLRIVLAEIKQKINEGTSFAKALSDYPKVFNNIFVNMVDAGESSGTLEVVLLRLAEFTEAQSKLKNKIQSALIYPLIMGIMGLGMMIVIFTFIIPKITSIFEKSKMDLPLATKICMGISHFLVDYWPYLLVGTPLFIFLMNKYLNTKSGKNRWHRVQLRLPLVGKLVTMINIARFSATLATLLTSGVPILTALNIVKNLVSNLYMRSALEMSRDHVSEGSSMASPLEQSGLYPPLVTHMISLGEKSGELAPMLLIIADNYEDQVNSKLDGLTAILEPIMMVVLGLVVGLVVAAVIIPLMELNTTR